jgi:cysteine desulfurase
MQKVQNRIYFDNASTTAINPEVLKSYESLLEKYYVNSESLYDEGSEIYRMMEKARGAIAGLLGVKAMRYYSLPDLPNLILQ